MRAVVQRVASAEVRAGGAVQGRIGHGLCVLVGVARGDGEDQAARLAGKIARLRVFEDEDGRFDRSLLDVGGAALVVSQFTLLADYRRSPEPASAFEPRWRGNRPSFMDAALPDQAEPLVDQLVADLRELGVPVETGAFGAKMEVDLVNDGPVTIILDA